VNSEVAAATLACLPKMTPSRLTALVEHFGDPRRALHAVRTGRAAEALAGDPELGPRARAHRHALAREWSARADPAPVGRYLRRRGTRVWLAGTPEYPIADDVPDRPAVLLAEGASIDALGAPRVAIVGTRAATPHGLADARERGAFCGAAGITVVSGMAIGIDGAAHDGVLGAGGCAVGVVATGLDIEYPRRHVALYRRVRASGLVVGETGFGVRPIPGRFPVSNRIIAALAHVVVVVEATITGGARITAQFALDYGRPVLAVPGSRRNPAAAGTNALIADGAHPLVEWDDVLVALGLSPAARDARVTTVRAAPGPDGAVVLRALGGEAATADQLLSRTGLSPERAAAAIVELERSGWLERSQGALWPR
jgi:DNA processing protein